MDENMKLTGQIADKVAYNIGVERCLDEEIKKLKKSLKEAEVKCKDKNLDNIANEELVQKQYDMLKAYYDQGLGVASENCRRCEALSARTNELRVKFDKLEKHEVVRSKLLKQEFENKLLNAKIRSSDDKIKELSK